VTGRVAYFLEQQGGRGPAFGQQAGSNYGHWLGLDAGWGKVLVLRAAGLIARRVTTRVHPGQEVRAGERIGRILLGSRAELYLPAPAKPWVAPGEVVRAGESVVARCPEG
jgi:phosphatidylserine decarboxylase